MDGQGLLLGVGIVEEHGVLTGLLTVSSAAWTTGEAFGQWLIARTPVRGRGSW